MIKKLYYRLFAKLVLFAAVFFLVDYSIGLAFHKLRDDLFEKNALSQEFACRYCIEEATPEIAIIGSSTASHHYIPSIIEDSLGVSVYNFGMDGCFFYFQNTLINCMLDRYSPSCIIWEIGESSLSSEYDKLLEYQNMNLLFPWYYNDYAKSFIDNKDAYQKTRMLCNSYRNNSDFFMYLRLCSGNNNSSLRGYIPINNTDDYPSLKCSMDGLYNIEPHKLNELIYTINRCQDMGVCLIITSSPRYYDGCVKSTEYYQLLKKIASNYDLPFIDFYNKEPFSSDSTLFKDNDHMNNDGANLYMSMFVPVLKEIIKDKKTQK